MEERLCDAIHQRVNERIKLAEIRLNGHSERLDKIEYVNGRLEERLEGLIKQLSGLTATLKWFIGLLVGGFVSFFFYVIQQGLFR